MIGALQERSREDRCRDRHGEAPRTESAPDFRSRGRAGARLGLFEPVRRARTPDFPPFYRGVDLEPESSLLASLGGHDEKYHPDDIALLFTSGYNSSLNAENQQDHNFCSRGALRTPEIPMTQPLVTADRAPTYTAFAGFRRIASGSLAEVALAARRSANAGDDPVFIYSDDTGDLSDVDMRGSDAELANRLAVSPSSVPVSESSDEPRRRGRPSLGVVGREVTLLPRHWDWLNAQPGGASVALRKLVEQARRANQEHDLKRQAHARAYRFMSLIAGDLPGFEEATRALFADDRARFESLIKAWPSDVISHATRLAFTRD